MKDERERRNVTSFLKAVYGKGGESSPLERKTIEGALKEASSTDGLLKPGYSRSAVTYLEREHPQRKHCEQVIFTVNLSENELQYPLGSDTADAVQTEDGRSLRRLCWDSAVNTMTEILTEAGLRPKALKNDRNSCKFSVQKEYLMPGDTQPDEYYAMEMDYLSEGELESRKLHYVRTLARHALDVEDRKQRLYGRWVAYQTQKELVKDIEAVETKRAQFIASNPDPRELDAGLVLHVEVTCPREGGKTKESMRAVVAEFIARLSSVASRQVKLVNGGAGFQLPGQRGRAQQTSSVMSIAQASEVMRKESDVA
jgi:hypothetical protein